MGRPDNPRVLVCVHGLTRSARDFDFLARNLAARYRVVCPDLAGRGDSDWLTNPNEYQVPMYVGDMVTLLARLDVESVDWVGTSLGGLVGMALAALPGSPITQLVLNDVGPVLTAASLTRIGSYVGKWPPLPNMEAAVAYVRGVSAPVRAALRCRMAVPDRERRAQEPGWLPAHALRSVHIVSPSPRSSPPRTWSSGTSTTGSAAPRW